jgi:hypothetical protein
MGIAALHPSCGLICGFTPMLTLLKTALLIISIVSFVLALAMKLDVMKRGHPLSLLPKWRGIELQIAITALLVGIGSVLGLKALW